MQSSRQQLQLAAMEQQKQLTHQACQLADARVQEAGRAALVARCATYSPVPVIFLMLFRFSYALFFVCFFSCCLLFVPVVLRCTACLVSKYTEFYSDWDHPLDGF